MDEDEDVLARKQTVYRVEMEMIEEKHTGRRRAWTSLSLQVLCALLIVARFITLMVYSSAPLLSASNSTKWSAKYHPRSAAWWLVVAAITCTVSLSFTIVGRSRDKMYASHAWTERRFLAPKIEGSS